SSFPSGAHHKSAAVNVQQESMFIARCDGPGSDDEHRHIFDRSLFKSQAVSSNQRFFDHIFASLKGLAKARDPAGAGEGWEKEARYPWVGDRSQVLDRFRTHRCCLILGIT